MPIRARHLESKFKSAAGDWERYVRGAVTNTMFRNNAGGSEVVLGSTFGFPSDTWGLDLNAATVGKVLTAYGSDAAYTYNDDSPIPVGFWLVLAGATLNRSVTVNLAGRDAYGVAYNENWTSPQAAATARSAATVPVLDQTAFVNSNLLQSGTATAGSGTTLTDSSKTWTTNQWQNDVVVIVSGTGVSQARTIASNTATVLTVSPAFSITPDTMSIYQIGVPGYPGLGIFSPSPGAIANYALFPVSAPWRTKGAFSRVEKITLLDKTNVGAGDFLMIHRRCAAVGFRTQIKSVDDIMHATIHTQTAAAGGAGYQLNVLQLRMRTDQGIAVDQTNNLLTWEGAVTGSGLSALLPGAPFAAGAIDLSPPYSPSATSFYLIEFKVRPSE